MRQWIWRLLPGCCRFCGEPSRLAMDVCAVCYRDLPWNANACAGCALPLPLWPTPPAQAARANPSERSTGFRPRQDDPPILGQRTSDEENAATVTRRAPLCGRCQQQRRPAVRHVRAALRYEAPIPMLIADFKFHAQMSSVRIAAQLLGSALLSSSLAAGADGTVTEQLVPIPMSRQRLSQRGFDQCAHLARHLGVALQLPVGSLLIRRRETPPQTSLDAAARRRNLKGAFLTVDMTSVPRHVTLVDDVMTTGSTLREAATALRRAGVETVDAWVVARTPEPR